MPREEVRCGDRPGGDDVRIIVKFTAPAPRAAPDGRLLPRSRWERHRNAPAWTAGSQAINRPLWHPAAAAAPPALTEATTSKPGAEHTYRNYHQAEGKEVRPCVEENYRLNHTHQVRGAGPLRAAPCKGF
jgi:hypothetical protein